MVPHERTDLLARLALIERMVSEGRRSTARRGWLFLLWGMGPLIAIVWQAEWPAAVWAWPAVMTVCALINGIGMKLRSDAGGAQTASMRSVSAVWICAGVTLLMLALCAAWSGGVDPRGLYIVFFALAAVAHGTSSLILRWLPQFLAALVWWLACVAAFLAPVPSLTLVAIAALVFGNIVFGAWLMYCERSREHD